MTPITYTRNNEKTNYTQDWNGIGLKKEEKIDDISAQLYQPWHEN